jgi:DinB superfamily
MSSAVRLLQNQWQRTCDRLVRRLEGLTDDEYRWEPVAGCWNVRPAPNSPSGWIVDYPDVAPDPPPFTTIAWRLLHISDGNTIYWEHAFGPRARNFWDLVPHGTARGAIDYLIESQRPITNTLAELDDDGLDEMRPTHFGVGWPARRVLTVLVDEQLHHGAEVALLRDLYRCRDTFTP